MNDYSDTSIVELATIVAGHLEQRDIRVVLVGGLAVEIYTENLYLTKDIDMVNSSYNTPSEINNAMSEIGFHKQGRVYINETTDICVEFPSAPLSVGWLSNLSPRRPDAPPLLLRGSRPLSSN